MAGTDQAVAASRERRPCFSRLEGWFALLESFSASMGGAPVASDCFDQVFDLRVSMILLWCLPIGQLHCMFLCILPFPAYPKKSVSIAQIGLPSVRIGTPKALALTSLDKLLQCAPRACPYSSCSLCRLVKDGLSFPEARQWLSKPVDVKAAIEDTVVAETRATRDWPALRSSQGSTPPTPAPAGAAGAFCLLFYFSPQYSFSHRLCVCTLSSSSTPHVGTSLWLLLAVNTTFPLSIALLLLLGW